MVALMEREMVVVGLSEMQPKKEEIASFPTDSGSVAIKAAKIKEGGRVFLEKDKRIFWKHQSKETKDYLWDLVVKGRKAEEHLLKGDGIGEVEVLEWGRAAEGIIIVANEGLVYDLVKKFAFPRGPLFDDLMQTGRVGLIKAVKKFDLGFGWEFSTFAVTIVSRELQRNTDTDQLGIAGNLRTKKARVFKAKSQLFQELRRPPTMPEIAKRAKVPEVEVGKIEQWQQTKIVSLETVFGGEDGEFGNWEELLIDEAVVEANLSVLEKVSAKTDAEAFLKNLWRVVIESENLLTNNEIWVLQLCFGKNGKIYSLVEVGRKLGLTRERIRQIKEEALVKVKTEFEEFGYPWPF